MIATIVKATTTVFVAVFAIALFGVWSYATLPREAAPDISIPVVLVSTPYVGVSPADVEALVTNPIENELAGLRDVKELGSTSAEGVSIISIEFEPDVVIEDALQRVRDRVNRAKAKLPEDVKEPAIREISFSDIPVLIVTIAGPVDEETLKELGEDVQDEAARVDGVLDARLSGGLTREVRVQVDPARLEHYGLSLRDVIGAIAAENVNIPGGNVRVDADSILIRTPGEFTDSHDIEEVAIKRIGDRPVFVRDVARIKDGFTERVSYARMNGEPAVSLSVTKRAGANIVGVADGVKALVAEQSKTWPEGVTYRVLADQSVNIANMVNELQNNIATALVLVVGVLLFFMGFRNSFFVALAIPLSLLISFVVLQMLGFTLNMVVLFALILALGMLVDNAIVVVENIYRHMEMGKTKVEASIDGTKEVGVAVAASTATTVAAFFPMVFWGGIMGEFMGYLPRTLIIVLIASLLVAVVILPVFTAKLMKPARVRTHAELEAEENEGVDRPGPVMRAYRAVLRASIRFRYASAALGVGSLGVTIALYGVFNHGTEFFPNTEPNRAVVEVRAPDGTDLETTDEIVRRIEVVLAHEPNVDVYVAESGVSTGNALLGSSNAPNQGKLTVDFHPHWTAAEPGETTRVESTTVTVDRIRQVLKQIPGAAITIDKENMGPPVGAPISVEVYGEDFHATGALAQKVKRQLAEIPGITDLQDDYRVGRPELALRVDRGAAARVGVDTSVIGDTVRTAVAGTKASELRDGEKEYDVLVEVAPEYREDLQAVLDLRLPGREVRSPDTHSVPLSAVASYKLVGGTGSIRHKDQDMVVKIDGDLLDGFARDDVLAKVNTLIDNYASTDGSYLRLGGSNDAEKETQAFLGRAFVIALVLIALVLVTQFDSLAIPFIVLMTVSLSLIGVLWGLLLTGTAFGVMMTGIGVISLAGVVVNNAIVLLDYVQQLLRQGMPVQDALVKAGMTRFRPVMLTAVTTVLGLIPMALGVSFDVSNFRFLWGGQSATWWGPMAVAVIFGLSFATVLTLVMVPTLYSIYDDFSRGFAWVTSKIGLRSVPRSAGATGAALLVAFLGLGLATKAHGATLEDAWTAAEEHNLDLSALEEQVVQAEAIRTKAWSTLSPRVTAAGTWSINQYETKLDFRESLPPELQDLVGATEPTVITPKSYVQGSLTVSQSLFDASSVPALSAAYRNIDAARLTRERTRSVVRGAVAQAYYALAATRAAADIARGALATAESQQELATRRETAGLGTRRDVVDARLRVSQARRDAIGADEQVEHAANLFHVMTGLPPETEVELPAIAVEATSLESALDAATGQRPDVRAADARLKSATQQRLARQLTWLPTVRASWTLIATQNGGFLGRNAYWVASVDANWTIWDGGLRLAEATEAGSTLHLAEIEVERTRRAVDQEVRDAWISYQRAQAAQAAAVDEVALADESYTLATRGLDAGLATWLDVRLAELARQSARLSTLRTRMDRDLAAVQLQLAIGTW